MPTTSIGPVYALKGGSFYQPFGEGSARAKVENPPPQGPPANSGTTGGGQKVLSLQELMQRAKEQAAAAEGNGSAPGDGRATHHASDGDERTKGNGEEGDGSRPVDVARPSGP